MSALFARPLQTVTRPRARDAAAPAHGRVLPAFYRPASCWPAPAAAFQDWNPSQCDSVRAAWGQPASSRWRDRRGLPAGWLWGHVPVTRSRRTRHARPAGVAPGWLHLRGSCITDSPASTGRSPPGRAVRQPECQWEIGSPRDTDHATVTPPPAPFCGGAPGASTVSGSRALRLQPEVPRGAVGSGHSGRLLTYFGTGNFESDGNEAPPRA